MPESEQHPQGMRSQLAPLEGRSHRLVPDSLAGAARRYRGRMADRSEAQAGRKSSLVRRIEFQRGPDGANCAARRFDLAATALLDSAARRRIGNVALLPRAQYRRDRLFANAVGFADGRMDEGATRRASRRRLAPRE